MNDGLYILQYYTLKPVSIYYELTFLEWFEPGYSYYGYSYYSDLNFSLLYILLDYLKKSFLHHGD